MKPKSRSKSKRHPRVRSRRRKAKKPAKHVSVPRSERTIAIVTGLKPGDMNKLAPQPLLLANIAYELGRVDRHTYLQAAGRVVRTAQPIGRLFSFHKQTLIRQGYLRFEKIRRLDWKREQEVAQRKAAHSILAADKQHRLVSVAMAAEVAIRPEAIIAAGA